MRPASALLALLVACNSGDKKSEPADKPEPAGVFHPLERGTSQGFRGGQLAVGGGFVYWVNQPRIDKNGLGKSVVERKPADGGELETVAGPGDIYSIAADADSLYWSDKRAVWARPHAGGEPVKLTAGAMWLEVVPGKSHLLLRSSTRMALVPKGGGAEELVWQGRRSKHHVAVDGDRFLVIEPASERGTQPAGTLSAFQPGTPPQVLLDGGPATGAVGAHGDDIYFSGGRNVTPPLWRLVHGSAAAQVGDPAWGFGEFVIARGALYGMIFTNKWKLMKLPLGKGDQAPVVVDDLAGFSAMVTTLVADDTHVYFLTDYDVKRVPL